MLTLILPIHVETPEDEAAVDAMLDSLEGDSLSLCQCDRLVLLSGTYSRELRGRLHKMASDFQEVGGLDVNLRLDLQPSDTNRIVLDVPCVVMKGWLDRIIIEADRDGGVVTQGPATYYPRKQQST